MTRATTMMAPTNNNIDLWDQQQSPYTPRLVGFWPTRRQHNNENNSVHNSNNGVFNNGPLQQPYWLIDWLIRGSYAPWLLMTPCLPMISSMDWLAGFLCAFAVHSNDDYCTVRYPSFTEIEVQRESYLTKSEFAKANRLCVWVIVVCVLCMCDTPLTRTWLADSSLAGWLLPGWLVEKSWPGTANNSISKFKRRVWLYWHITNRPYSSPK
jgi:hypothetical protein